MRADRHGHRQPRRPAARSGAAGLAVGAGDPGRRARPCPPSSRRTTSSRCWSTRCDRRGGTVRFGAPLTALRTTADGVRAVVGGVRVRARFVVGADGPRSTVRTALGIGSERLGVIGEFTLTLFRADGMPSRPSALNFVSREGVLLPLGSGRWGFVRAGREPSPDGVARGPSGGRRARRARDVAVHDGRRGGERVPGRAGLPRRRRRAPHDALRRGRAEHRHPRRARAGLAAGLGRRAGSRGTRCCRATPTSASRWGGRTRCAASAPSGTPTTACRATWAAPTGPR